MAGIALIQWMFATSALNHRTAGFEAGVRQPLPLPPEKTRRAVTGDVDVGAVAAQSGQDAVRKLNGSLATRAIAAIEAVAVVEPPATSDTTPASTTATVITLSPGQKAERLFSQAQAALARQDRDKAMQLLQHVLAQDQQDTAARGQLAMLMIQGGQLENAEALLSDGLLVTPFRIELGLPYAQLLIERGALVPALQTLERFTDSPTADAEALALQAGVLDRLHRYSEAVDAYQRALRLDPAQAVWWTGLGVALEHQGQPATALDAYRRAAQLPVQAAVNNFVQLRIQALDKPQSPADR
jgi:tetratricopeptide (TPR) repeat protein